MKPVLRLFCNNESKVERYLNSRTLSRFLENYGFQSEFSMDEIFLYILENYRQKTGLALCKLKALLNQYLRLIIIIREY